MTLAEGSEFAEYTIEKLLGAGGMGKVYLAQHPRLPRSDALKVIRRSLSTDDEYRERFRREAEAAAILVHPNIVGVRDRGEYRGRLWIAMDYIDGDNLGQILRRRFPAGMPPQAALTIISAVADALDYAHRQDVVHRDVKPSNILVEDSGEGSQRVLLADFGIARQLSGSSGLTASNLAIGTVAYAAPEQLMGSDGLDRADQYALAATAFHLLTGAPPFADDNPVTVISHHLNAAPPVLSEHRPELGVLDDVLLRALAKEPADRYANCRAFAAALSEGLDAAIGDSAPESVSTVIRGLQRPTVDPAPAPPMRRLAGLVRPGVIVPAVLGSVAAAAALIAAVPHLVGGVDRNPPAAAPVDAGAPPSAPQPQFDGTYRVDANRAGEKYNGVPNPQPPNVSTWWAVRSSCRPSGCTATGTMLDDNDHRVVANAAASTGQMILDFAGDSWQSRPQTQQSPCVGVDGRQGTQTTTQVLTLAPTISGVLHGAMVATVDTNECGQRGAEVWVPVVASRFGDVAAGVAAPDPATLPAASSTPGR